MTPSEYKRFKNIDNPLVNHRDYMNDTELIFTMLGEVTAKNMAITEDTIGFEKK